MMEGMRMLPREVGNEEKSVEQVSKRVVEKRAV